VLLPPLAQADPAAQPSAPPAQTGQPLTPEEARKQLEEARKQYEERIREVMLKMGQGRADTTQRLTPDAAQKQYEEQFRERMRRLHDGGADTTSSPDTVTVWIPLKAEEWAEKAPKLRGKDVEVSGNLNTMVLTNPSDDFSNTGDMVDEHYNSYLKVMFDRIAP